MSHANLPEPPNDAPIDEPDSGDDFEISGLPAQPALSGAAQQPPPRRPTAGAPFGLSARAWRGLIAVGALLIAFAVIFNMAYRAGHPAGDSTSYESAPFRGSVTGVSSIPTETINQQIGAPIPTAQATPLTLNQAPASCPPPLVSPINQPPLSETIGAGAVWVGSFTGAHATMTISQKPLAGLTQYGWPVLITVLVRSDFDHPVTISGSNLSTGYALWWSFPPADEAPNVAPATGNTFTPQHPAPGAPIFWFTSYGTLFLPGAGCYMLQASWPNGGWKFVFAAGA